MTRAWVWLLSLLLGLSFTVGCDDPAVADRSVNILQHGAVQAEAVCKNVNIQTSPTCSGIASSSTLLATIKYDLLQDGSTIVSEVVGAGEAPETLFADRSADKVCAFSSCVDSSHISSWLCFHAASGQLVIDSPSDCTITCASSVPYVKNIDLATSCTGFNLSAFGVTP